MKEYIGKIISPFNNEEYIDYVRLSVSNDIIEVEFSSSQRGFINIRTIHGVFNGFGKVTLINCENIEMSTGAGAAIKKYSAQYLFKGEYIDNPEEFYFDRVKIEMTGLLDWTKLSVINNELYAKKKLNIKETQNIEIYNSEHFSIELTSSYFFDLKRKNNQINIKENAGFRIKSNNGDIDIWKFLHLISELKKLFFILSNKDTQIDSTTFYKGRETCVTLFWSGNNSIGTPFPISPRIKFQEIKFDLRDVIYNWFEKKELQTSIELILEKSTNQNLSRENYFLNNCFSIETLHRRFYNYKLFDKTEFKLIKNKVLNSIEEKKYRELIGNSLAHINEPNFRKRLLYFKTDFSRVISKNWDVEDYIMRIVKSRNYLVHRSSTKNIFDEFDMLYASIFIETVIKINVYRILGVNENIIEKMLTDSGDNIQKLYDVNKQMIFQNYNTEL